MGLMLLFFPLRPLLAALSTAARLDADVPGRPIYPSI